MVGLTNPRQRMTRLQSGDGLSAAASFGNRGRSLSETMLSTSSSRSPSPISHHRLRVRGGGATMPKKKSKLPLFLPLLIFLGVFWIGLQGSGPDDSMPANINDNRGSRLVVDAEEETVEVMSPPGGGSLRGAKHPTSTEIKNQVNTGKESQGDASDQGGMKMGTAIENEQQTNVVDANHPEVQREANAELPVTAAADDHLAENPPPLPDDTPQQDVHLENPLRVETPAKATPVGDPSVTEKVVSIFLEPRNSLDESVVPLPVRMTSANLLERIEFPHIRSCKDIPKQLPINNPDFPERDPFLPWIHDYFVSTDGQSVQFVAQNKRRCQTGHGKEVVMAYWQAQVSLFQPVPIAVVHQNGNATNTKEQYRLATPNDKDVVAPETRFQCRFHRNVGEEWIAFSRFAFHYEYIVWRKRGETPMFVDMGPDVDQAELSQLLFSCPIPDELKASEKGRSGSISYWVDIIPIRTPPRRSEVLLTTNHTGPEFISQVTTFDASKKFGTEHVLPAPEDSGRWANLPICIEPNQAVAAKGDTKPHQFVACTWASASYHRRGDENVLTDTAGPLREWITFNRVVAGMDHIYLYDNTQLANSSDVSPLQEIVKKEFKDYVTYISWPAQVCNDHKTNDKAPGERSSQYAAEASCLQRFGPLTEWMTFLDVDEYLIPRNNPLDWKPILEEKKNQGHNILSFRRSRGRPRLGLMHELADASICESAKKHLRKADSTCIEPRSNETLLRVYNCDSNPPPRPNRFEKTKKQIVRPAFVLQHVVHNTTVTKPLSMYYQETNGAKFTRELSIPELVLDEVRDGFLVHVKTIPPPGMLTRSHNCKTGSTALCSVGYVCPATTAVNDTLQSKNLLRDAQGRFCNCWVNDHVEQLVIPQLKAALRNANAAS